jgi:nucleoside phosphorylase
MAASTPPRPSNRSEFEIAIICALPIESDAVESLFDHFWDENSDHYGKAPGDENAYTTGVIGNHNVVLAYMPDIGKGHAAKVAANFRISFRAIKVALLVGICGGVPSGDTGQLF